MSTKIIFTELFACILCILFIMGSLQFIAEKPMFLQTKISFLLVALQLC